MAGGDILGIDPGNKGALAFLHRGGEVETFDMPTHKGAKGESLDERALATMLDARSRDIEYAFIEKQWARPTDGGPAAFKVGLGFGALRMLLAANFIPYEMVSPQAWKRFMGLTAGADKDSSRQLASRLLPRSAEQWRLKTKEGRAEAALIALYAARHPIRAEAA